MANPEGMPISVPNPEMRLYHEVLGVVSRLRPQFHQHGCVVEIARVWDGGVDLHLRTDDARCALTVYSLKECLERALKEELPHLRQVTITAGGQPDPADR